MTDKARCWLINVVAVATALPELPWLSIVISWIWRPRTPPDELAWSTATWMPLVIESP